MITDSQIKEEAFLEDIDSLLNTGEVANLYAVDEKQELIEAIRPVLAGKYGKDREFTPLGWFLSPFYGLHVVGNFFFKLETKLKKINEKNCTT